MGDWSSYTLSDFLLFSPRVYERLFVLHNQDLWPAQLLAVALGAAVFVLLLRGTAPARRAGFVILGAAWIVVAGVFFLGRYQEINWLGAYIAPLAALQGALLTVLGLRGTVALISPTSNATAYALATVVLACGLGYPLLEMAVGSSLNATQTFALTPDPTAVATLGAAGLLAGRLRFLAALIPALWCAFTILTLSTLGRADGVIAASLLGLAMIAIAWPRATQDNEPNDGPAE